jgi:tRNA threonylcarbamoyladenosine biosynthesis protein TsaE
LEFFSKNLKSTWRLGRSLGANLKGGEIIELIGDIGSGKTALVKGIVKGANFSDEVASPTFTLSRIYQSNGAVINHYDFHRLDEPGILKAELAESIQLKETVIIEWPEIVMGVLPPDRLTITISVGKDENFRYFSFNAGKRHKILLKGLKK